MPIDLTRFRAARRRWSEQRNDRLRDRAVEAGTVTRERLANFSPIDTGRFSGSWNAQDKRPDLSVKPEGYENPLGAPDDGNVNLIGFRLGDDIHISNNLVYGPRLNDGHSRQAPAGFVELVSASTARALRNRRLA